MSPSKELKLYYRAERALLFHVFVGFFRSIKNNKAGIKKLLYLSISIKRNTTENNHKMQVLLKCMPRIQSYVKPVSFK